MRLADAQTPLSHLDRDALPTRSAAFVYLLLVFKWRTCNHNILSFHSKTLGQTFRKKFNLTPNPPFWILSQTSVASAKMSAAHSSKRGLPTTIEGATSRYIDVYERLFKGFQSEKTTLISKTYANIMVLRTKAPKFFEEKLPRLLNQAASTLLSCDVEDKAGLAKFNNAHRHLLLILDELRKTQPEGDVNFQTERDRLTLRDTYRAQQLKLREEISLLESIDFDVEDLGSDDSEAYNNVFRQLDAKNAELKKVSMLLAQMEGESLDEEIAFELKIPPRSILERLTIPQRNKFEELVVEFLVENNHKNGLYLNQTVVEDILLKIGIHANQFSKDQWRDLSKEALDACKRYFRDKENALRDEYFDSLVKNKYLRPKEGEIIASPDALPDEIKAILDQNQNTAKRKIEELEEDFSKRPAQESTLPTDDIEDEVEEEDTVRAEVDKIVREAAPQIFTRIKEEPRSDYADDAPSDDELIASEAIADKIEEAMGRVPSGDRLDESSDEDISDLEEARGYHQVSSSLAGHSSTEPSSSTNPFQKSPNKDVTFEDTYADIEQFLAAQERSDESAKRPEKSNPPPPQSESESQDEDSQELVPLGIITPQEKIETITID